MHLSTRRILLAAIAAVAMSGATARADYVSAVQALNPIDYWRFETADRDVNDGSNALQPDEFPVTVTNAVGPSSADGYFGFGDSNNSLHVTSAIASKITFPEYVPVAPGVGHTFNFWVKPTGGSGGVALYGGVGAAPPNTINRVLVWLNNDGSLGLDLNWANANMTGGLVAYDEWNMITVVVPPNPGNVQQLSMYLNGQPLTNTSGSTDVLQIGFNNNMPEPLLYKPGLGDKSLGGNLAGAFDEVAFFGEALTGEQIAALYQAALTPVPEPASASLLAVGMLAAGYSMRRTRGSVV